MAVSRSLGVLFCGCPAIFAPMLGPLVCRKYEPWSKTPDKGMICDYAAFLLQNFVYMSFDQCPVGYTSNTLQIDVGICLHMRHPSTNSRLYRRFVRELRLASRPRLAAMKTGDQRHRKKPCTSCRRHHTYHRCAIQLPLSTTIVYYSR